MFKGGMGNIMKQAQEMQEKNAACTGRSRSGGGTW